MSLQIPDACTVLVIGGGPGGSYTASALAREGVKVVVLEADVFPRYHIGESMLASIRHFFRFVDLESKFDAYGFEKKLGASFKLNDKREAYTDFIAVNGPNGYSWNVIRSESDKLMFEHAASCGARTFDGTRVESIEFEPTADSKGDGSSDDDGDVAKVVAGYLGRPVAAKWSRRGDGASGTIRFDYLVDASGRAGILSTKYLKNRKFNQGLKNVASWGYWRGAKTYAPGTEREGQPFFEALDDQSGWCWAIPLHNGTLSVGIVMRQDQSMSRKKALGSSVSSVDFYKHCLTLAPMVFSALLSDGDAELVGNNVKAASDWSYSAPAYAGPYFRIVGDAGCFIDPFFSSGLHLAVASGLSAAMTIQAARRGDDGCDEQTAARWHSRKVAEGYTRFLLVVMMALKQIRKGSEPVLSDFDDDGFEKAFGLFNPIIQGLVDADVGGKLTQSRVSETVAFCLNAYHNITPEDRKAVFAKLERVKGDSADRVDTKEDLEKLTEDELRLLRTIRARQMIRTEDTLNMDHFAEDAIDGLAPHLQRGSLGLTRVAQRSVIMPEYTESLLDVLKRPAAPGDAVGHMLVRQDIEVDV